MKKTGIFIILLFLMQTVSAQEYRNNIGVDFLGANYVYAPNERGCLFKDSLFFYNEITDYSSDE